MKPKVRDVRFFEELHADGTALWVVSPSGKKLLVFRCPDCGAHLKPYNGKTKQAGCWFCPACE